MWRGFSHDKYHNRHVNGWTKTLKQNMTSDDNKFH